jgi:hypothetical protein
MNYWQVAAGYYDRDYSKYFMRFGKVFIGEDHYDETREKLKKGDRVLLKQGISNVLAVGEIVERNGKCGGIDEDRTWDFDGWCLPAYYNVQWHKPRDPIPAKGKGLVIGTIKPVGSPELKALAEDVLSSSPAEQMADLPPPTKAIDDKEILDSLIRHGLRPEMAEELTNRFNHIRQLAHYYYEQTGWSEIREHETRTFLVIPLLLALGWAEQQIKIELPVGDRKRADIVCFSRPYGPENSNCVLILETKGFVRGLDFAPEQAKAYANHFPDCKVVAVTNGYCYKTYKRQEDGLFAQSPSAYLNLLCPQSRYPLKPDDVEGCLEVLATLLLSS